MNDLWSRMCQEFPHEEYEGPRMLAHHIVDHIDSVLMAAREESEAARAALRIIRQAAHIAASEAE